MVELRVQSVQHVKVAEYAWSGRALSIVLAVAVGAAATVAQGQRARRLVRVPPIAEWELLLDATEALARVHVQPGDANGQVRAWDSIWRARLERLRGHWSVANSTCSRYARCGQRSNCERMDAVYGGASRLLDVREAVYEEAVRPPAERPALVSPHRSRGGEC